MTNKWIDLNFEDNPVPVDRMVWIYRPGKNVPGTAFLAIVRQEQLKEDGTIMYAGEVCQWKECKL